MISKETILKYVTQEEIMRRYFPFEVSLNKKYCNPFREDRNPGCTFKYSRSGVLYFLDWAYGINYDCFKVASEHFKENNFQKLLKRIDKDFSLNLMPSTLKIKNRMNITQEQKQVFIGTPKKKNYHIEFNKQFSKKELEYWSQYNVSLDILNKYGVKSVFRFYFSEDEYIDGTNASPIFYYPVGEKNYQIYCPFRRKEQKFYSMIEREQLFGTNELPEKTKRLIITKSPKDVLLFASIDIPAISVFGEKVKPTKEQIQYLTNKTDYLYINFDSDEVGTKAATDLKNIYPEFFTNSSLIYSEIEKDFSDLCKEKGVVTVMKMLKSQFQKHERKT